MGWLRRGQAEEAIGTDASLQSAIRCYDFAIRDLLAIEIGARPSSFDRELGVLWMNRGNALLKRESPESLADAVAAYDAAIAALRGPAGSPRETGTRNSLGAAWMNRGLALHRLTGAQNLAAALLSYREAIAWLETLPLEENPWFRRNLAAARINFTNALLDHSPSTSDFTTAANTARTALQVMAPTERKDRIDAELALKARRGLCDALGHRLARHEQAGLANDDTAAEVSDLIDAALELIRFWERPGQRFFRPLAARFLRFGAHLYTLHQPHFLAEFLLENLDPAAGADAFEDAAELAAIAEEALTLALQKLRHGQPYFADDPESDRRRRTCHDLSVARARLAALAATAASTTGSTARTSSSSSPALSC